MVTYIVRSLLFVSLMVVGVACQKASTPAPPSVASPDTAPAPLAPEAPKAERGPSADAASTQTEALSAAPATRVAGQGLPASCEKLLTCCTEWVKVNPNAEVGCTAQRNAFRAAKTPEAKAGLGDLCEQALAAWSQLTNIPAICK